MDNNTERTVFVSWYDCDCDWFSKYCDEFHRVGTRIPISVLREFNPREIRYDD